jgi:hypothetical protein
VFGEENYDMASQKEDLVPADVLADLEEAANCAANGRTPSPEFVHRIALEAERIREEVKRKHGILDIGVPAIRELRDA